MEAAVNVFTLLTILGGIAVIASFFSRTRPRHSNRMNGKLLAKTEQDRLKVFDFAVGLTILSALMA